MLLPWIACTGRPAASAGFTVCAPIRSPQWITACAPAALAACTACASGSARSWLSETMQIFNSALLPRQALVAPARGRIALMLRVQRPLEAVRHVVDALEAVPLELLAGFLRAVAAAADEHDGAQGVVGTGEARDLP